MSANNTRRIKVWDLPLRIFHWALLACFAGAIISVKITGNMEWHARFGYAILTLLLFRLIWGCIGGTHARFANFLRGPRAILAYLKAPHAPGVGHNPLGALSVFALLGALLVQAGSGLFITDEILLEGPLFKHVSGEIASLLARIHDSNAEIIIALVGLHIAAIVFYSFVKRDRLVPPMITGSKEVAADSTTAEASGGSIGLGLLVFAICAAAVGAIVLLA